MEKVKSDLADKIDEITLIWMCGPKNRNIAFDNEITKWTDEDCTSETLGFKGQVLPKVVDMILQVNSDETDILPRKIINNDFNWQAQPTLEFFIDFETLTSIFTPQSLDGQQTGHDTESFIL